MRGSSLLCSSFLHGNTKMAADVEEKGGRSSVHDY